MRGHLGDGFFRWRSREVLRIEAFSDAVFAFSLALLVISTEVPSSFAELAGRMKGFPAFGLSFMVLVYIWYNHHLFFRRYALETPGIAALNGALLFVVLFYTYPLKALPALVIAALTGVRGENALVIATVQEGRALMAIYSAGFGAVFLILALMTALALRHREQLELTPVEILETKASLYGHLWQTGIAGLSLLCLAAGLGSGYAGWTYLLMWPVLQIHFTVWKRRVRRAGEAAGATG